MSDIPPVPRFDSVCLSRHRMKIQHRFLRVLLQMLVRHLRLQRDPYHGTSLSITPWNQRTLMRIRLTISWVEGHRVMYLGDQQILLLFKRYCNEWYPNYYNLRSLGYENIIIN